MDVNDLEFLISQYADGTLAPADRSRVEQDLAEEPAARELLAEYEELNAAIKASSLSVPDVRWEALAAHISDAIDAEEDRAAQRFRIGALFQSSVGRIAIAASVAVAMGLGVLTFMQADRSHNSAPETVATNQQLHASVDVSHPILSQLATAAVLQIDGPRADVPAGPVVVQVAVGPGEAMKEQPIYVRADDADHPSQVAIASGVVPAHDDVPLSLDMQ